MRALVLLSHVAFNTLPSFRGDSDEPEATEAG
jgi:hypothetical protein